MNLNCTFVGVKVMKKVLFFIGFVLLALCIPTYSYALKSISSNDFKIVKQKKHLISTYTKSENLYMDADLLEEDNDAYTTERKKLSSDETAFAISSFLSANFTDMFVKPIRFTNYSLNFSQPCFIYFRVLRL